MKIPAQVFAQSHPDDLAPGTLFRFGGSWALRVSRDTYFQGFLMLEGERAGSVFELRDGVQQVAAIVHPFCWFPMVVSDAVPTLEAERTATLTLTEKGLVIVGLDARDQWGSSYLDFSLAGEDFDSLDLHLGMRFDQWSVELCHTDRPYVSLGTLLQVDRRSNDTA